MVMKLRAFESPKMLIRSAKESFAQFEAGCTDFVKGRPYCIVERDDPETGQKIVSGVFDAGVPETLLVLAYRIIGDTRNSLDQATCDAALVLGCADVSHIHFPTGKDIADLDRETKRRLRGVDPDFVAYVRSLDAYFGGNNDVWALGRIAGPNKHQRILDVAIETKGIGISPIVDPETGKRGASIDGEVSVKKGVWNSDNNELELYRLSKGAKVKANLYSPIDVVLGDVEFFAGKPAIPTFENLIGITDGIVVAFEFEANRLKALKGL